MNVVRASGNHGRMGLGGRRIGWLSLLVGLALAFEARAQEQTISLIFDASAEELPKEEIRAAVERELGRPVVTSSDVDSVGLVIGAEGGRLIVRYQTENGSVERTLPTPSEPSNIPLIVSLAAGNLARDQRDGIAPTPSPPGDEAAPTAAAPQRALDSAAPSRQTATQPPFKRHWVGLHAAQDIAFVHGTSVCQRELSEPPDAFWCFYPGAAEAPFFHDSQDVRGNFEGGPTFATTRLLLSYDFAIIEYLTVGTRLGYAFGGGPPADQQAVQPLPPSDRNLLPPGTIGTGGNPFMPFHAELRANFWFLPLTQRWFRAYVGGAFGLAQVDSKHHVEVIDCAETLDPTWDPADGTFDDCVLNTEAWNGEITPISLDAWNNMGRGFVAASAGSTVSLTGDLAIVLNVNAMYMFPTTGIVIEPSLGIMTSFLNSALVGE